MKNLKFLVFTIFIMLIFCGKVQASATNYWYDTADIIGSKATNYFDISGTGSTLQNTLNAQIISTPDMTISVPVNVNNMTISHNGIAIITNVGTLKVNYLYSISMYVCSDKDLTPINGYNVFYTGNSGYYDYTYSPVYGFNSYDKLSEIYSINADETMTSCYQYSHILSPAVDGSWVALRLRSPDTTIRNGSFYFMGYTLRELGIYDESLKTTIDNIVQDSGFATASSVQEVQRSVNTIQTEVQGMQDKQQQTNNKLDEQISQNETIINQNNEIKDTLNSSNVDNPENAFSQFDSYLPENGVITQLITLPISLFQRVLSSINGSCSSYNLGNLMGTDLILPCINISNYIGTTLWNVIDILFSGFFVLVIGKKMIKAFNNFTSMEEGDILD